MNKLQEKILKEFEDTKKQTSHPEEFLEFLLPGIMEIIEDHSSEAFYAGRDEYHTGCGDYEYSYDGWTEWYKEETNQ
jgi:hypothetical protein